MPATTAEPKVPDARSFWQRRVVDVIVGQLKQGITPEKVSLTIALGVTLAMFPIMGSTTLLCGLVAFALKLNQPIIQLVNWLMYPVQLSTILVYVRIGEWITRAQRVPFSIPELLKKFKESPANFMREFGMTGLHGIIGWVVVAPFVAAALYFILLPAMRKLSNLNKPVHAD
ncbi:MAG TPA: DUF2062 domain-containing protein [Verrucomicrobiae bacterium]|jgi:uncharacterized protein (DUF2062 family)|nr:DUF2062 domain-containing protein [Verrucomicrobiae bacterium]